MALRARLVVLLAAVVCSYGAQAHQKKQSPIRKVVSLLQQLQTKVTEEGKTEEQLYEKYKCYCSKNKDGLSASVEAARNKIVNTQSAVKEAAEKQAQTEQDLKAHKQAREDAKAAIAQATAIREKEASAFAAIDADYKTNLDALAKAIAALEKGIAGSFLQSRAASGLKTFVMEKAELSDSSRNMLLDFLSGSAGYVPRSNEVVGLLKQLADSMGQSKAEAVASEAASVASFNDLVAAKTKELETLQAQIEQEQLRIGELATLVATGEADVRATEAALDADSKFLVELANNCQAKDKAWEEVKAQRAEELVALSETINLLNSDDALDIFGKALPAADASFVQVEDPTQVLRRHAKESLERALRSMPAGRAHPELNFIALALSGKQQGFEKVIAMVDEMVASLKKEQVDDDSKKQFCEAQLDAAEDQQKALEQSAADSDANIAELEGSLAKLKEEIEALREGTAALDKSTADATAQRQAEHKEYNQLLSDNKAAKDLLLMAKNRLQKFYNPALHVTTAAPVLSEEDRLAAAVKQSVLLQLHQQLYQQRHHDAPPPPPQTFKPFEKKGQATAGVMQMMDLLVQDLDKEVQEGEVQEKHAQEEYEQLMEQAAQKRAEDSSAVTELSSSVAAQEESLQTERSRKAGTVREISAVVERIGALHSECDWLQQHYEVRKEARAAEVDALQNAKAVLNGADYAMVQEGSRRAPRSRGFLGPVA